VSYVERTERAAFPRVAEAGRGAIAVVGGERHERIELLLEIGHAEHRESSAKASSRLPEHTPKHKGNHVDTT
jgi:hypothetical protein